LRETFGDEFDYFISWLARSYTQVREARLLQGHALFLTGEAGTGKTLILRKIISSLLGGSADAELFIKGRTAFNSDLVSSPLLTLDDANLNYNNKEREAFGNVLKKIVAGESVQAHAKGVDGITCNPLWRLCMCVNNDKSIQALPFLDENDSVSDKVLVLTTHRSSLVATSDSMLIEGTIEKDLPAFAQYLIDWVVPDHLLQGNRRFGFSEYINPEVLKQINANSIESITWNYIEAVMQNNPVYREDFKFLSKDFLGMLEQEARTDARDTIIRQVSYMGSAQVGRFLSKVAKASDGALIQKKIHGERYWTISEKK